MKTIRFSLVAIFSVMLMSCLNIKAFSQNEVLVLAKQKNGKEKTIKQGKKIKIWTNTGKIYKGYFTIKEDSLVILGEGSVSLNDVEMISKKSNGVKIAGSSLAGIGGSTSVLFGIATVKILNEGGWAIFALIVIVPVEAVAISVTATGVILLTTGKKYKKTKWDYKIKNIEMQNQGSL